MAEGRWPYFAPDEEAAALEVVRSGKVNYWTGDEGKKFESEFAAFTQSRHAIVLGNGTLALELALKAAGIGPGDDVIVTPRTFVASASCVVTVGARPVFADVDLDSGNVTPESVERAWTADTRAVLPVHLAGWPCDLSPMIELASSRGAVLIEDCAQAHGAEIEGRSVGSFGLVNAWSFCQDKIMTTLGEGGAVTTNDTSAWEAMWAYKDHGKSYDAVFNRHHEPGFRWLHESFGSNYRLSEVQSAVGRKQLQKLPDWVATRRAYAERLVSGLADCPALRVPTPDPRFKHAYYKWYGYLRPEALRDGWNQERVIAAISERGIKAFSGSCSEVYLEKCFVDAGLKPASRLPNARALGETSLMLLVHPTLSTEYIDRTIEAVRDVLSLATR